jgi:hypothetical protein
MGFMTQSVVACATMLFALPGIPEPRLGQTSAAPASYESFMQLDRQARSERFGVMRPGCKSMIMRTHAKVWLEENRVRLSDRQVTLIQEAIEFLSPELYRNPSDPKFDRKSAELERAFRCALPRSDVMELFGAARSFPMPRSSWLDDIWAWFEDCVVR